MGWPHSLTGAVCGLVSPGIRTLTYENLDFDLLSPAHLEPGLEGTPHQPQENKTSVHLTSGSPQPLSFTSTQDRLEAERRKANFTGHQTSVKCKSGIQTPQARASQEGGFPQAPQEAHIFGPQPALVCPCHLLSEAIAATLCFYLHFILKFF